MTTGHFRRTQQFLIWKSAISNFSSEGGREDAACEDLCKMQTSKRNGENTEKVPGGEFISWAKCLVFGGSETEAATVADGCNFLSTR